MNDLKNENKGLRQEVKSSLKAFDMSLKSLQIDHKNYSEDTEKATIQVLYDVGVL